MSSSNTLLSRVPSALLAIATLAVLVLAALGVRSWLAARDATTQLTATIAAQKQLLGEATAREQQRDTVLTTTLASVARAKNSVQTPAQAAAQIPSILPALPAPVLLNIPAPTPDEPAPPAEASIPQADLKPIYDDLQDCHVCQAQLSTAQSDLADERSKVTALTAERNAATKAAHGGSFWSRLRQAAKWFAVGAAVGAAAGAAATAAVHR